MGQPINIVFDGPPGPVAGRFVEVETDDGKSINAGEWIHKGDCWVLRITELPKKFSNVSCSQCGKGFGPGNHGYSHCEDHREKPLI